MDRGDKMIALLKVSIILGIIVVLINKKFPLAWALIGGSLIMGISFGLPLSHIFRGFKEGILDWNTIKLLLILYLIALFENILREKNILKNMVLSFKTLIKDERVRLISMPTIMGLLPSVGGALFSAPLLEEISEKTNIESERKSYINYWFRHIWEPFLPIYPGILLVSVLTDKSLNLLVKEALPYGLAVFAIGLFFAFYKVNPTPTETIQEENQEVTSDTPFQNPLRIFLLSILPIIILLTLVILFHFDLLYVLIGLVLLLFFIMKVNLEEIKNLLINSLKIQNLILIAAVMIFKRMLEITGAVSDIAYSLNYSFLPTFIIFLALPLLAGIFTGVTSASIGITFPILMRMLPYQDPVKYIILAFVSAFLGVMVSPLHLCLILTKEYFQSDWNKLYSQVIKSGIVFGIFLLIKFLLT